MWFTDTARVLTQASTSTVSPDSLYIDNIVSKATNALVRKETFSLVFLRVTRQFKTALRYKKKKKKSVSLASEPQAASVFTAIRVIGTLKGASEVK